MSSKASTSKALCCFVREHSGDHLFSRKISAVKHIPPFDVLEVVAPQQLMMNTVIACFKQTRHADVEQSVIQRGLEACTQKPDANDNDVGLSQSRTSASTGENELKHLNREQVQELTESKLDGVGIDAIKCATMWDNCSVMVLVDPWINLRQVEKAVEGHIHSIVDKVQGEHL